jgi:4-amino-4-deoxy-L-arabinose transferase-like glycosyltransferase
MAGVRKCPKCGGDVLDGYCYSCGIELPQTAQPQIIEPQTDYYEPRTSYNEPQPGYREPQRSYNEPQNNYNTQPGYREPQRSYNEQQNNYNAQPGYREPQRSYNEPQSSYSKPQSGYSEPVYPNVKVTDDIVYDKPVVEDFFTKYNKMTFGQKFGKYWWFVLLSLLLPVFWLVPLFIALGTLITYKKEKSRFLFDLFGLALVGLLIFG